jgi:hypothetical protein
MDISLPPPTITAGKRRPVVPTVKSHQLKGRKRTMLRSNVKQLMLGAASAAVLMASSFAAHAGDIKFPPHAKTNINLAVASNFYGVPPSNSAITDLINAFTFATLSIL